MNRPGRLLAIVVIVLALVSACAGVATPAPVGKDQVALDAGRVRGSATERYRTFEGIPYAAPPTGERRWQSPRPPERWSGVRDARRSGDRCAQTPSLSGQPGSASEDCLFVTVTTPPGTDASARPVMVWLHGGGFSEGSGDEEDARRLAADGDVVVVSVNYRLGIFGLLGLPGLPGSGTFALQDQLEALRWVQRNISAFGGDPGQVTLAGVSAGAKSVCALLAAPAAAGLFHRAIMQSGPCSGTVPPGMMFPGLPAFDQWTPLADRESAGAAAAAQLGCPGAADALGCLRALPVQSLLSRHHAFITPAFGGEVLPVDPAGAIRTGARHPVPTLSGTTRDELSYVVAAFFDAQGRPIPPEGYPAMLRGALGPEAPAVAARYPLSDFENAGAAWSAVTTDRVFSCPAAFRHDALAAVAPTYTYEFGQPQQRSQYPGITFEPGAAHTAELPFLFPDLDAVDPMPAPLRDLSDTMIGYWGRFIHTGDPNGGAGPRWPRHSPGGPVATTLALSARPPGIAPVDLAAEHHCDLWAATDQGVR